MGGYLYYTTGVRHSSVDAGLRGRPCGAAEPLACRGVTCDCRTTQRAWPAVRSTHTSRLHKLIRDCIPRSTSRIARHENRQPLSPTTFRFPCGLPILRRAKEPASHHENPASINATTSSYHISWIRPGLAGYRRLRAPNRVDPSFAQVDDRCHRAATVRPLMGR